MRGKTRTWQVYSSRRSLVRETSTGLARSSATATTRRPSAGWLPSLVALPMRETRSFRQAGPSASEDAPILHMSLERGPRAPSLARAAVAGFSERAEIPSPELDTLTLLVSELVSNAVLHSDAPPASGIVLCARVLSRGEVRVEVIDRGSGFSATPRDPAQPLGGFGLYLVEKQATRWGVDREAGTRVWFELARHVEG
jgi:anti-sigma regulatory factor (Ser/Thr protein kinase)